MYPTVENQEGGGGATMRATAVWYIGRSLVYEGGQGRGRRRGSDNDGDERGGQCSTRGRSKEAKEEQ